MKKLISTLVVATFCFGIVSCNDSAQNTSVETQTDKSSEVKTESNDSNQQIASELPKEGTIKKMVNGDIKCYVTLIDDKGKEHELGAIFEVCEQPESFVNKTVSLSYKEVNVSDCESAEPCGKTKVESLISTIKVL